MRQEKEESKNSKGLHYSRRIGISHLMERNNFIYNRRKLIRLQIIKALFIFILQFCWKKTIEFTTIGTSKTGISKISSGKFGSKVKV